MAKTKYHITLSDEERNTLTRIVCEGTESERTVMRARILLMSDYGKSEKLSVSKLAEKLGTTGTTIQTVRTEYAKEGFEYALFRKKREIKQYKSKVSDEVKRYVVSLSETAPPDEHKRWSCKLLADAAVEAGVVDSISPATILRILQAEGTENSKIRRRRKNNYQ